MYQTLLVPLDGSTRAESILPHVENWPCSSSQKLFSFRFGPFMKPSSVTQMIISWIILKRRRRDQ